MAITNSDGSIVLTTKVDDSGVKQGVESTKKQVMKLSSEYKKAGMNASDAMRKAWSEINHTKSATEQATKSIKKYGEQARKSGSSAKNAFSSVGGALKKFALVAIAAFSVKKIIQFTIATSNLATTAEASVQRLIAIYGSASKAVGDFIDANAQALGMSRAMAASYASVYGNLFSVWADQATNAELTNAYLNMTAVVASKTGRTVEDVQERIRSGLLGNTEAIEDLGVFVNVKTIEMTDAFKRMANGKSWEQLDAYTQQQVRTFAILEQATQKYGNEVAQTSALAKSQFNAAWQDFQATWGQVVNRVLVPVLEVLTEILVRSTALLQTWFNISSATISESDNIETATKNQNKLTSAVNKTEKATRKALAGFDDLQILTSSISGGAESGIGSAQTSSGFKFDFSGNKGEKVSILSAFLQEIKDVFAEYEKIDFSISKLIRANTLETLSSVLDSLADVSKKFIKIFAPFWNTVVKPITEHLGAKLNEILERLNGHLSGLSDILEQSTMWEDLREFFEFISPIITPIVNGVIDFVTWVGKLAVDKAWEALVFLLDEIESLLGTISKIIKGDFAEAWEDFKDFMLDNMAEYARNAIDLLDESFGNLIDGIKGVDWNSVAYSVGQGLAKFIVEFDEFIDVWYDKTREWWTQDVVPFFSEGKWKTLAKSAIDGIKHAFTIGLQNAINGAIDILNSFIDGWNDIANTTSLLPNIGKISHVSWFETPLPSTVTGSRVPTQATYGSNRGSLDGSQFEQILTEIRSAVASGNSVSSNRSTEVVLEIDGREFGRAVVEQGNRENRRIGTRLVIA